MKIIFSALVFFVFAFAAISPVLAQTLEKNETVAVERDEIIDEDYFAWGETAQLSGTINGDAYAAGGNLNFDGTVNGDLFAAGGQVNIRGTVTEDLRVAGGQVIISGVIHGNITVAGGSVEITDAAQIGGSVTATSGNINVYAPIEKGLTLAAGSATIGDRVGGNVTAAIGDLSLTPDAQLAKKLVYYSSNEAVISPDANIAEGVTHNRPQVDQTKPSETKGIFAASILFSMFGFLASLLIAFILIKLAPNSVQGMVNNVKEKPVWMFLLGMVAIVLAPFIFIILLITVIGIPIALISLFAITVSLYLSKIFVAAAIGQALLSRDKKQKNSNLMLGAALGLFFYYLLGLVPVLGFIIGVLVVPTGFGAILAWKKDYFQTLRSKNLL